LMAIGAAAAISSGALAQNAVQWRVEDGGNGHWYRVNGNQLNWVDAQASAIAAGGHLATITAANEGVFVWAFMHAQTGTAWLGARAATNACTDASSYLWITGEVSSYTNWAAGEPNGGFGSQDCAMEFAVDPVQTNLWNDAPIQRKQPSVVEWSADCNGDAIVDYGQIRSGELADTNANNIPDCCENGTPCGCAGDTNLDGTVDGIDLATVLTRWAQSAAKFPEADCNRDGVIDGADLATVLGSWGACP